MHEKIIQKKLKAASTQQIKTNLGDKTTTEQVIMKRKNVPPFPMSPCTLLTALLRIPPDFHDNSACTDAVYIKVSITDTQTIPLGICQQETNKPDYIAQETIKS